jgi:hypothetical protein
MRRLDQYQQEPSVPVFVMVGQGEAFA